MNGMQEEERLDLVEIGTDMGIFSIVNMLLEGATFDRETLQKISALCAEHIEEVSGMPAVVFSMMVKPAIEQLIKKAKERT